MLFRKPKIEQIVKPPNTNQFPKEQPNSNKDARFGQPEVREPYEETGGETRKCPY